MYESKIYKAIHWRRNQMRRDAWERKYNLLIRNILNKQFKDLSYRIDVTNYRDIDLPSKVMQVEPIEKMMISLYTSVGIAFAKEQYSKLKAESQDLLFKADEPVDEWYNFMQNYAKVKAGKRIVSIAASGREQAVKLIKVVLEQATTEGWGADVTASAIRKSLLSDGQVINQWRALRIARTEIVTASNQGAHVGALELQKEGFDQEKYWIPTYDSRTRDTHLAMDEQNPKDMDEAFIVGGVWPAEMPGDPDLPPEESINCRCAIAYGVKGM